MTAVTKFEDLIAWQEARKLARMIYKITSDGLFSRDFGLKDQIQSAAVSAMTNIAEGFDNESAAEFARLLGMARRSAVKSNIQHALPSKRTKSNPQDAK